MSDTGEACHAAPPPDAGGSGALAGSAASASARASPSAARQAEDGGAHRLLAGPRSDRSASQRSVLPRIHVAGVELAEAGVDRDGPAAEGDHVAAEQPGVGAAGAGVGEDGLAARVGCRGCRTAARASPCMVPR